MQKTPKKEFSAGYKQRHQYPLLSGLYKLREARQNLLRMHDTVSLIKRHKEKNLRLPDFLNQCMRHEVSTWLKATPTAIAWQLGYNIAPGVDALTGDGLNTSDISSIKKQIKPAIDDLILNCELTHTAIKKNIGYEYRNMKSGQSELLESLESGIKICDTIIHLHGVNEKLISQPASC